MTSRYQVWLKDGQENVSLESINPGIYVSDIKYSPPEISRDTMQKPNIGYFVGPCHTGYGTVDVSFSLEVYDTVARQSAMAQVAAWAMKGGWLTTSDRPGQRLYVVCDKPPVVNSVLKWTETITITFTAYGLPYWQDSSYTIYKTPAPTYDSTNQVYVASVSAANDGNFPAFVAVKIIPSASMASIDVRAGSTRINLYNINLASGHTLRINYYDDTHIQYITDNGTHVEQYRTATSDDDLILPVGGGSLSVRSATTFPAEFAEFQIRRLWV